MLPAHGVHPRWTSVCRANLEPSISRKGPEWIRDITRDSLVNLPG
ncbi:hypothetical protein ACISK3_12045 [Morganella morganii]